LGAGTAVLSRRFVSVYDEPAGGGEPSVVMPAGWGFEGPGFLRFRRNTSAITSRTRASATTTRIDHSQSGDPVEGEFPPPLPAGCTTTVTFATAVLWSLSVTVTVRLNDP